MNGWAQGFVLPPGGGQLSITRNNLARVLSLSLELIATLAICLLALPGKRADPVQEAKALAALREARNGKRAADSARRAMPSLRAAAAGHRAGGIDRLGSRFAGRRRAGLAQDEPELANDDALADQAEADYAAAVQAAGGQAAGGQAATGRSAAMAAGDVRLADAARSEAATTTGLAGRRGRHAGNAGDDRAASTGDDRAARHGRLRGGRRAR